MRATTVLLYSRVSAISFFFLRLLVALPARNRGGDVRVLAPFTSAAQQDEQRLAIPPEIHPVTRAKIQSQFRHAFTHDFGRAEIARLQPADVAIHPCRRYRIK